MQNNGYWPYVSKRSWLFLKGKMRQNANIHFIHERKSEQELVRCEMNTKEKSTKSRVRYLSLGPDKRGITHECIIEVLGVFVWKKRS